VVAPELDAARAAAAPFVGVGELALELADYAGLATALVDGAIDGRRLVRAVATDAACAAALLAIGGDFEVVVPLRQDTAPWLAAQATPSPRLVVRQPTYDRVSDHLRHDVDPRTFFAGFPTTVPVENVPACILGRPPRPEPPTADAAMLRPDGRLEIFRFTRRFVAAHFYAQALRCRGCREAARCRGQHVNQIRAHGFAAMSPLP
jgi:hypothetical protein